MRSSGGGRSWYAVGVLLVAYVFSIMDRQILTLLVGPIQKTLHVNDTLMGILHGFTFAAFYALMGLPIARIIDRGDRRLVIAIGIALWSLATAAGGLATDYWHLLLARIGVAVGEAVLLPGAVSLIADLFAARQARSRDGRVRRGGPFGSGAGLIAGGLILGSLHGRAAGAAVFWRAVSRGRRPSWRSVCPASSSRCSCWPCRSREMQQGGSGHAPFGKANRARPCPSPGQALHA